MKHFRTLTPFFMATLLVTAHTTFAYKRTAQQAARALLQNTQRPARAAQATPQEINRLSNHMQQLERLATAVNTQPPQQAPNGNSPSTPLQRAAAIIRSPIWRILSPPVVQSQAVVQLQEGAPQPSIQNTQRLSNPFEKFEQRKNFEQRKDLAFRLRTRLFFGPTYSYLQEKENSFLPPAFTYTPSSGTK